MPLESLNPVLAIIRILSLIFK